MTLVLYLPFREGILLMADRKVTNAPYEDNYKKIKIHEKNKIPLVCTASCLAPMFDDIYIKILQKIDNYGANDVFDKVNKVFIDYINSSTKTIPVTPSDVDNFSMIVLKKEQHNWSGTIIGKGFKKELSNQENYAIGSGVSPINPHLKVKSHRRILEEIIDFGFHVMKLSSEICVTVGDPLIYKCDMIVLYHSDGYKPMFETKPSSIDLNKILYRFDDKNE